jgi:hypothetical protein
LAAAKITNLASHKCHVTERLLSEVFVEKAGTYYRIIPALLERVLSNDVVSYRTVPKPRSLATEAY